MYHQLGVKKLQADVYILHTYTMYVHTYVQLGAFGVLDLAFDIYFQSATTRHYW